MKFRDYKFGFNVSALVLFAVIMLPNIIWFCYPSHNDVLRGDTGTQILDIFASIFQVATVAALCILKNKTAEKLRFSVFLIICGVFCALYYICWILYYCAVVHTTVLIGLSVFPCISFAFYAVDRKNYIAIILTVIFAVLHFTSTAINFF